MTLKRELAQALMAIPLVLAANATANADDAKTSPDSALALPGNTRIGNYVGEDIMIPMRDGTHLHAQVWRPADERRPLPILLQRSPYGFDLAHVTASFGSEYQDLAKDGFIFVLEDVRGRFGSEGQFVMLKPSVAHGGEVNETTDAYDSVDWLVRHITQTNGKVGIFGVSYLGWTTAMAIVDPHPAVKAVSVQASPEDMFIGDDFRHNGAFRLDYAWEYASALETEPGATTAFSLGKTDLYDWYLKHSDPLATLDRRSLGRTLQSWQDFVAHPNYDSFHKERVTTAAMPAQPTVPNLIVAGWWDQEDFYGPLTIYKRQEAGDSDHRNFLVVGPWNHGGWAETAGDHFGPFALGSNTGHWFRANVELPWFRYWLKGEGELNEPEALIFETGSNQWRKFGAWPPRDAIAHRHLYLRAGGILSSDPPTDDTDPNDRFISDPANPVPFRPRPIRPLMAENSTWPEWEADDQAVFSKRPDVLTWMTPVLSKDVTLRGNVSAKVFASTTGTDADWVIKLIDVYPSDTDTPGELRHRQLLIVGDVMRGRFRDGFDKPRPIPSGKVLPYTIDLHSAAHLFKAGHRIAVQLQSSWFPLIDRNPQKFMANMFDAVPSDYRAQVHTIYHSTALPSLIEFDAAIASK